MFIIVGASLLFVSSPPAHGATVLRRYVTFTSLSCQTPVLTTQRSTCTVTVTGYGDMDNENVTFSSQLGGWINGHCTMVNNTCTQTYVPSGPGKDNVTAVYPGDLYNYGSTGTFTIDVSSSVSKATTTASASCASPFTEGSATTCTATVSGNQTSIALEPIAWSSTGTGSFSATTCSLSAGGSCSVAYTPVSADTETITAVYAGDASNQGSQGTATLVIDPPTRMVHLPLPQPLCEQSYPCDSAFVVFNVTSSGAPAANVTAEILGNSYNPNEMGSVDASLGSLICNSTVTGADWTQQWGPYWGCSPGETNQFSISTLASSYNYTLTFADGSTISASFKTPQPWTVTIIDISQPARHASSSPPSMLYDALKGTLVVPSRNLVHAWRVPL